MRLDKFLSVTGTASRSESKRAVRAGSVTVNGIAVRSADLQIDPEGDRVCYCGREIVYRRFTYILLNKPEGVVSATDDARERTVLDLLPDTVRREGLFPCGRLDKNTLGVMLLTDDGELAHRLLSPKRHVSKAYFFRVKYPLADDAVARFCEGLELDGGERTLPACLEPEEDGMSGVVTLVEGKYHQIKRMMEALNNKVTYLERIRFGNLLIENSPPRGEWRYLNDAEIEGLRALAHKEII